MPDFPKELQRLYSQYPSAFERLPDRPYGQTAPTLDADLDPVEIANQAVAGFVEGFTALPGWADDPRSPTEYISRSIGHLFGFVGLIPGLGNVGSVTAKGIGASAKALGLGKVLAKVGGVRFGEKILANTAMGLGLQAGAKKFRSAPMLVGDIAVESLKRLKPIEAGLRHLDMTAGGRVLAQTLESSVHLGLATAVSESNWLIFDEKPLEESVKDAMQAAAYGAAFGGMFALGPGMIWKIPGIQEYPTLNTMLRTVAGGLIQGLPATLNGEPTYSLVYNYLLGGVFGAHTPSAETFLAAKWLNKIENPLARSYALDTPEGRRLSGFDALPIQVKEKVNLMHQQGDKPMEARTAFAWILENFNTKNNELDWEGLSRLTSDELSARLSRPLSVVEGEKVVVEEYRDPDTGEPKSPIAEVLQVYSTTGRLKVKMPGGESRVYPFYRLRKVEERLPGKHTAPEDIAAREVEDFDPISTVYGRNIMITASRRRSGSMQIAQAEMEATEDAYLDVIKRSQADESVVVRDEIVRLFPEPKPTDEPIINGLVQMYYEKVHGVRRQVGHYDATSGKLVIDTPVEDIVWDSDNNRINVVNSKEYTEDLLTLGWVKNPVAGGRHSALSFMDYEMSMGDLARLINSGFDQGYVPFTGRADKPEVKLTRIELPKDRTPEEEWMRIDKALTDADTAWPGYRDGMLARDKKLYGDERGELISKTSFITSMRKLERIVWGTNDNTGDLIRTMYSTDPYYTLPKTPSELPALYPEVSGRTDLETLYSGAKAAREIEGHEAETYNRVWREGKWDAAETRFVPRTMPKEVFGAEDGATSHQKWMVFKMERERLVRDLAKPKDGEHMADFVDRINDLAAERMRSVVAFSKNAETKRFNTTMADRNKRLQLLDHKFYTIDQRVVSPEDRAILSDVKVLFIQDPYLNALDYDRKPMVYKEASDGGAWMPRKLVEIINRAMGHNSGDGHEKVFIRHRDPLHGIGVYKPLLQTASSKLEKMIREAYGENVILMPLTSAKAIGLREVYGMHFFEDKPVLFDKNGNLVDKPILYKLDPADIGVAFGVKDPAVKGRIQISKSILTTAYKFQMGEKAHEDLQKLVDEKAAGLPESNDVFTTYVKNPTPENLRALDKHWNSINARNLLDQLNIDDDLKARYVREVMLRDPRSLDEWLIDDEDFMEYDVRLAEAYGDMRRVEIAEGDPLKLMDKTTKGVVDELVKRHILARVTRPYVSGNKMFVSLMDPWEVRQFKYTVDDPNDPRAINDKIYLNEGGREIPVNGYTLDGTRKPMTLGEQVEIMNKLAKEKPIQWEQTTQKIRENVLRNLFERDPMDDATGYVTLNIAGFTGRPGNGAIMSPKYFQRLSGMDGDGDTINMFNDLPKSTLDWADKPAQEQFERLQTKAKAGEKPWYSEENPMLIAGSNKIRSASADPTAMMILGLEVAKGRGGMMGFHSSVKHSVMTILDNLDSKGTYYSPIYDYSRRWGSDMSVLFVGRTDKEETMKFLSDGSHVFVDVAKKGAQLPSKEQIELLNLAAGFQRIIVFRGFGEKRKPLAEIDLSKAFSPDHGRFTLPESEAKKLQRFIGLIWRTDIGIIREVNRKFYRSNRQDRRPWTLSEVADVADRYPYYRINSLYGTIANNMRGMSYNDGILHRVMPYFDEFFGNARNYDTILSRITKSKLRFPFLTPKNVTPNWQGMMSRMAVIRMHWRPDLSDKYNWATPNGLMMYSRYRETEMVNNMVDFYRITRTEQYERDRHELGEAGARGGYMSPLDYVRYIDTEVSRTFGIVKGLTPKEQEKLKELEAGTPKERYERLERMSNEDLHDYMKIVHNSMTETQRSRYLNSYVNQVEDFISTRFRDIAGLYEMTRVYHALDMDGVLARRIIAGVTDTKEMYDRYSSELLYSRKLEYIARKKKWSPERLAAEVKAMEERSEELHAQHGTPDAVKSRIERLIDRLAYNLPDVNKGRTKNLTRENLEEFAWTVFASSLDPHTGKTRVSKRLDDVVPPEITKRFMDLNKNLWTSFTKRPDRYKTEEEWVTKVLMEHPGVKAGDDQWTAYRTASGVFFGEGKEKGVVPPDEMKLMAKEVADIMKSYKNLDPKDPRSAWEIIQGLMGWRRGAPTDVTYSDLVGLRNTLVGMKLGPGMLRWFRFGGPDKWRAVAEKYQDGRLPTFMDHLGFFTTTADRARITDLFTIDRRLFDDEGKLSEAAIAMPTISSGRLDYVYSNAKEPMGRIQRMIEEMRGMNILPEQIDQMDIKAISQAFAKLMPIRDESNVDQFRLIMKLAAKRREMKGSRRELDEKTGVEGGEEYAKKQADFNEYKRRHLESAEEYKSIAEKIFHLPSGETINGEKAVTKMEDAIEWLMKDYGFDTKIALTKENSKRYFKVKNGIVELGSMMERISKMVRQHIITEQIPADVARGMEYFNEMHHYARKHEERLTVPHMTEVESMSFGIMKTFKEILKEQYPSSREPFSSAAEARLWLGYFLRSLHNPDGDIYYSHIDPELRKVARDAVDVAKKVLTETSNIQKTFSSTASQALRYFGHSLTTERGAQSDPRWLVANQERHDQFELDKRLARGEISKYDYLYHTAGEDMSYSNTGETLGYWPHLMWDKGMVERDLRQRMDIILNDNTMDQDMKLQKLQQLSEQKARILGRDAGSNTYADADMTSVLQPGPIERSLNLQAHRSPNQYHREYNIDGYSYDLEAVSEYFRRMNRATYQRLSLMLARNSIEEFERDAPMGQYTKQWADIMRYYARNALGGPSLFTNELLADPASKIRSTPFYWLSDHFWGPKALAIHKTWLQLTGADLITDIDRASFRLKNGREMTKGDETTLKKEKTRALTEPTEQNMMRAYKMLNSFSIWEGRYEMASLLFHAKTAVANVLGGTINDWVYNGARFMLQARDFETWKQVSPRDPSTGEPIWKSMEDVHKAFFTQGIIEDFITREANLFHAKPARWNEFATALAAKIAKDPNYEYKSILDLGKEYGITENILEKSGAFMRVTERKLRTNSFLAAYLAARSSMEPMQLEWNNPWLIAQGKRAIEASQFLYGAETRPLWAATNVGKVYSRFKLWAWSSVKYRRLVFEGARNVGYAAGTPEFNRLQRMISADLFLIGLATLLPYTMLDYGLPAPLSYFQDLAAWMFGDDKQRERAYFVQSTGVPAAVAPLNELMPPIARFPKGVWDLPSSLSAIWGGQIERLGEYTTYSIFPGGRMAKDIARSIKNPSHLVDIMTGIPFDRLAQTQTKLRKKRRHGPPYYPW